MANYPAIERQSIIKEYINGIYRTKKQILKHLEESGISIVPKTVERDFNSLKNLGYGIEHFPGRGYILKHYEEFQSDLLNRINSKTKLNKIMGEETELSDYILDNSVQMEGIDLIPEIFKGFKEKRQIEFDYKKHTELGSTYRKVIPLWLKEDKDLWYLIAVPIGEKTVKVFGLDRIKNLKITSVYDASQITSDIIEQTDNFRYRLGVSRPTFLENPKRELIELAVSDFLLPYWKSKPVHPTQRITNQKNEGYTIVSFVLVPNIDLIKFIVSGLGDIKLIRPVALKQYIGQKYDNLMEKIV